MSKSSRVDFAGVESQLSIDDGENDEFLDQPIRDGRSVGGLFSSCGRPLTLGQFVAVVGFVAIILIGVGAHQAAQPQTNQASTTTANLPTSEALVPTTFAPSVALPDSSQCDSGCAKCGSSSSCFFGECYCHPGFTGPTCTERATKHKAGSWFFNCPNVKAGMLFDKNDETIDWTSKDKNIVPGCPHTPWTCLMMCFENEQTGIMQIPLTMWRGAQSSEAAVWAGNTGISDRGEEHVVAFGNYDAVPLDLGHVIEVGTGPWTQFRYMWKHAHSRGRQLTAKSFTVMEPGGIGYVKNTPTCAFKDGVLRDAHGQSLGIPTVLNFAGVEHLRYRHAFDTLMVMNVVEHVQDGYMHFQNIYHAIRPGGILIFHERYFEDLVKANCVLGDNPLHPIRLRKLVLDKFLSGFETLWLNDQPTPQMVERNCNEKGYYFIGRKKKDTQLADCCSSRD